MNKKQALAEFKYYVLPAIKASFEQNGRIDRVARAEAWNNFTDALCKDGRITMKQYENWANPF